MNRVITFLSTVKRCEVTGHYGYNDFDIICDEDRFFKELTSSCDRAVEALCKNQNLNLSLINRMVEEAGEAIDKNLQQLRGERFSSDLLRNRVLYFLGEQKRNLDRFRSFLLEVGGTQNEEAFICDNVKQMTAGTTVGELPYNPSNCYTAKEICIRIPQMSYNDVKDRQWRIANGFPNNPTYKGKQLFYEPDVLKWLEEHSGYGSRISRSEAHSLPH